MQKDSVICREPFELVCWSAVRVGLAHRVAGGRVGRCFTVYGQIPISYRVSRRCRSYTRERWAALTLLEQHRCVSGRDGRGDLGGGGGGRNGRSGDVYIGILLRREHVVDFLCRGRLRFWRVLCVVSDAFAVAGGARCAGRWRRRCGLGCRGSRHCFCRRDG